MRLAAFLYCVSKICTTALSDSAVALNKHKIYKSLVLIFWSKKSLTDLFSLHMHKTVLTPHYWNYKISPDMIAEIKL